MTNRHMKIIVKPIKSLLVLYTALNYNGYDMENNASGMSSLRTWVRKYLRDKKVDKFDFKWHPFQYTKAVLSSGETNPDFLPAIDYLAKFAMQSEFESIWPKIEKETEKALEPYQELVERIVEKIDYLFDMEKADGDMLFTVNLLESHKRGFSIQDEDRTILITGPSDKPNIGNVIHEYMHSYLHGKDFGEVNEDLYSKIPEELQKNYPKSKIVEESLIRALEVYLSNHLDVPGKTELKGQAKDLVFPEIYLEKLEKLRPNETSLIVLKQVVSGDK